MRWTELRGVLAFAAMVVVIALVWQEIESRDLDTEAGGGGADTSLVATTTIVPATSTTTRYSAVLATCERTEQFVAESELIPQGSTPGPQARLALDYWRTVEQVGPADIVGEVGAVVNYYEDYLTTGEPFDFDIVDIIFEGDKERYEQLITRPAPGLEVARNSIQLLCGVEVADQPSMSSRSFDNLEDRLLFPEDDT